MNEQNGTALKYLTVTQAAQEMGAHRNSILNWIHSGRLQAGKTPGGHYRIRPQDIQKMLDEAKKS